MIPPNLAFLNCYSGRAEKAVEARTGIWKLAQYRQRPVSSLTRKEHGYRVIRGEITHIGASRRSIWLEMGRTLVLQIDKNDLKYFSRLDIDTLSGRTVQARGLLYLRNGRLRIRIRHPVNIRVIRDK